MRRPDDPDLRQVAAAGLTLGLAVGVFGAVFGVGAVSAGASVGQACVLSLLVFTGASQFSAVSVIASGGSTASALGGAMVLAGRNTVYGLTMARYLGNLGSLGRRLVASQLVIDETTAITAAQEKPHLRPAAFWLTGITLYVCWNAATFVGAVVGSNIDPETYGLDVAFPAGYVAMVAPHFRTPAGRTAGLLGAAICLALTPFTPIGVPILCASAAVLVGVRRP
jgi:4-azaleucine resistance transporter AzlC